MTTQLIADRRTNEVRAVGKKSLLHQQIDVPKIHVAEVDRDLFGLRLFAADHHCLSSCHPLTIF